MVSVREAARMSPLMSTTVHRALAQERFEEMSRQASCERQASCIASLRNRRRSATALVRMLLAVVLVR
jgi:hypothetical protein